jgi:ribonuclease HII
MLKLRHTDDGIPEVGIDEAGRGPLWGPLVAAAVLWPPESEWTERHRELAPKIQDSKKISAKKRAVICKEIQELALGWGIGIVSAQEIDTFGATKANCLAFRRAVDSLVEKREGLDKYRLLIDGILRMYKLKENEEEETIVDGDALYLSIAAASIVAKEAHDTWVVDWCKENIAEAAKYDLLNCKGYGTAKHRAGVLKHGYTELHRRLYLRKLIPDIVVSRCTMVEDEED